MNEVFRFWGFSRTTYRELVGRGRLLRSTASDEAEARFGAVELSAELVERCGPFRDACSGGWLSWLVVDERQEVCGEPLAWFRMRSGRRIALVTRTNSSAFHFRFDLDATIRFIQNERFLVHRRPGYVRLGVNPDRLPACVRRAGFRWMQRCRGLRSVPRQVFPSLNGDPSIDAWRRLIRSVVEEHSQASVKPFWPGGKRYAVTFNGDIDTNYAYARPAALDGLRGHLERAGVSCAWMAVGRYVDEGRSLLTELHGDGHEIGCHGMYHDHKLAFLRPEAIRSHLRDTRELLREFGPVGFRSPSYLRSQSLYESLDGVMDYDMSMHDAIEHRSGMSRVHHGCATCFPFRIDGTDVFEIPTTVLEDWNLELCGCSAGEALSVQMKELDRIRATGGVANVCIHPEPHFTLRDDWLAAFGELALRASDDSDAWIALPRDINRYVRQREARIAESWAEREGSPIAAAM